MRFRTTSAPRRARNTSPIATSRRSRRWKTMRCFGWRVPINRPRSSSRQGVPRVRPDAETRAIKNAASAQGRAAFSLTYAKTRGNSDLLLTGRHRSGELVVIFDHKVDIALVLDRRCRVFQGIVEIRQRFFLVLWRHFL